VVLILALQASVWNLVYLSPRLLAIVLVYLYVVYLGI
jgi:hypothetical protein